MRKLVRRLALLAVFLAATSCDSGSMGPTPTPGPLPSTTAVFVGAGDVAECGSRGTEATAALLDGIGGTVFTAGDNAYPHGTTEEFLRCYDPTWGRHKGRTYPVPGNHDYDQPGAAPYYTYFGPRAGPPGLGYYSYNLGAWHIVALNSNVPAGEGSAQLAWLRDDLASTPTRCLAAVWHHPLFTSGPNPVQPEMRIAWRVLREAGAEFVVTGNDHLYERFTPADEFGRPLADGIRQFIVGTGGAPLYSFAAIHPESQARASVWGVIKFTLSPESYTWEFVPIAGESFRDTGTVLCH